MSAKHTGEIQPIPVTIVEALRAPTTIVGAPTSWAVTAVPVQILPESTRRKRAVVSIVGTGVVAFGNNGGTMQQAVAGSAALGALVQGPAVFELQSTNIWWAMLASGTNTTVSVMAETEKDQ